MYKPELVPCLCRAQEHVKTYWKVGNEWRLNASREATLVKTVCKSEFCGLTTVRTWRWPSEEDIVRWDREAGKGIR